MPQNLYEFLWVFLIYAFIGWCTEVAYAALDTGKFVNRGFLNGPYCPVYGFGMLIVITILTPLKESLLILFLGSLVLTTVLEYITGFLLEKVFHNKWWDYSDKPFNIQGYICLKFSIYWGLACTFVIDVVHPILYDLIGWIPFVAGAIVLGVFFCVFAVDCCVTVSTILKFNARLKVLDEMALSIHKLSDEIGENIYENTSDIIRKTEEFQESHAELMDKLSGQRERITQFPETAKNSLAETSETARELLSGTTEAAKEKLTGTTEAAKAKLSETTEAAKAKLSGTAEATRARFSGTSESSRARLSGQRENILEFPGNARARFTEAAETLREKKQRYEELTAKYQKLFNERNIVFKRLMKAFPGVTSKEYDEILQKWKEKNKGNK